MKCCHNWAMPIFCGPYKQVTVKKSCAYKLGEEKNNESLLSSNSLKTFGSQSCSVGERGGNSHPLIKRELNSGGRTDLQTKLNKNLEKKNTKFSACGLSCWWRNWLINQWTNAHNIHCDISTLLIFWMWMGPLYIASKNNYLIPIPNLEIHTNQLLIFKSGFNVLHGCWTFRNQWHCRKCTNTLK